MITIIFAPPRTGKTCYLTHLACMAAFDRQRNKAMQNELLTKKAGGFTALDTIPNHCVSANYSITMRKFGYSPRVNRYINPYRLGFSNGYVETHYNLPYEFICITEAQKYLNSRMSVYFPDWQSRWYEQHGHNKLDIFLDVQRPGLIDINIRELAQFVEIVSLKTHCDGSGKCRGMSWQIREISNSGLLDRYISGGKQDKGCYTERTVTADYDVFSSYDSFSCKPKFYAGRFNSDIDYIEAMPIGEDMAAYERILRLNDDELPENFYKSRSIRK